jgi:hypothetical protein
MTQITIRFKLVLTHFDSATQDFGTYLLFPFDRFNRTDVYSLLAIAGIALFGIGYYRFVIPEFEYFRAEFSA